MPLRSRLLPRMIFPLRTPSVVRHPSAQCVQMVPTCSISHGRGLIAINPAGQRAHRADVDAGAALVAFQMIVMIGHDLGDHAAIGDAQRVHAHAFIANPHAAIAENAARRVEKHHRRPLLFVGVNLALREPAFAGAVAEHHVLQLALAALVAHRAIQRMIGQQELEHPLARLLHHFRIGVDHHAFGHRQRAADLQLRSLLHLHQAHAAGGLQRVAFVIAERRNLDAVLPRQPRSAACLFPLRWCVRRS